MSNKKIMLEKIVGVANVCDDSGKINGYSKDMSFVHSIKPRYIVKLL